MWPDPERWRVRPPIASTGAVDARDLLGLLDPRTSAVLGAGGRGSYVEPEWLYRGSDDTAHALLPKALRPGAVFWDREALRELPAARDAGEQVWREASTVRQLLARADRHGLPVPGDQRRLRRTLEAYAPDGGPRALDPARAARWPPEHVLPLLALAQHHGLATRLLDWTYHPFVAAYFAAREGARRLAAGGTGSLCVWITTRRYVNAAADAEGPLAMRIVAVPAVTDENLRAQEGLFIATGARAARGEGPAGFPAMDAVFRALEPALAPLLDARGAMRRRGRFVPLARVDLALAEAPALLGLLSGLGFTAARLFPGLAGVVDSMREASLGASPGSRRVGRGGRRALRGRR